MKSRLRSDIYFILVLFFLFLSFSCSLNINDKDKQGFIPIKYSILKGKTEVQLDSKSQWSEDGFILMNDKFLSFMESNQYIFELIFLKEESYLILHFHFSGFDNLNGIQVKIKKESKGFRIFESTPSTYYRELGFIEDVGLNERVELYFEIHNEVDRDRLVTWIWFKNLSRPNYHLSSNYLFNKREPLISNKELSSYFPSGGRGLSWGAELQGVSLQKVLKRPIQKSYSEL